MHTAESKCTPWSQKAHHGVKMLTLESKCTLQSQNAHRGVKMHTAESKCTLRRQNEQRKVRIKNFAGFWLLSKEQTGKNLPWVSTSIFKVYKGGSLSLKLLPRCESPRGVRIFKLYNRIFRQHRKYFSLFIRGPDGFESWKNIKVSNLVTNPFKPYTEAGIKLA